MQVKSGRHHKFLAKYSNDWVLGLGCDRPGTMMNQRRIKPWAPKWR